MRSIISTWCWHEVRMANADHAVTLGPFSVAAVQMTSGVDVAANLARARELLGEAAARGARLAVLPENFALMAQRSEQRRAVAEEDGDGPIQDRKSVV